MPVPFFSGTKLSINLAEDTVLLRGMAQDDGTFVLRGEVELVVTKPVNVSSVVIKLIGKSFTLWMEGIGSGRATRYSYEKKIHEQDLVLQTWLPTTPPPLISKSSSGSSFKSTLANNIKGGSSSTSLKITNDDNNNDNNNSNISGILSPGLHRWPFEFFLSNKLVETIEDETGKVFYYLTATVHRSSGMKSKIKCRRNILVLRTPHADAILTANSLPTTSIISDRRYPACDATICVEKSMASSGTQFPIDLTLVPNMKNVFLESISVLICERRVYRLPEFDARRGEMYDFKMPLLSITNLSDRTTWALPSTDDHDDDDNNDENRTNQQETTLDQKVRSALFTKNAHVPLNGDPFQFRFIFNMPNCIDLNHSSTFSEIDIRHFLKLSIDIRSPEGPLTIRLDTNITVLDCRLKEDYAALPTYEAALSDVTVDMEDDPSTISGNRSGFFICPCYLSYKKKRQVSSKKEWIMMRHNNRFIGDGQHYPTNNGTAPPSYDTIISDSTSSQHLKS
ncbi:uncharacterized protein BX664DRAFT_313075 [Halteromyces radiatus]|uniref:uncharacterized protein n=1 Tax=Halteromyces radiatus TaxID=101107 RepID=UPI00221FABE5|nr:uncharacterized protein BX664DRAFT_313075 [Halteromyces radiatus]KAI8092977.1 hypothetical protein BX664DRAFT_313075 [Halteromyces radiatus]